MGIAPRQSEQAPRLAVGNVVSHDSRLWRVGLVNTSRARLDPLSGSVVIADPTSGRSFNSYGSSVNVSPNAYMDILDPVVVLDGTALARFIRMEENEAAMADGGANGELDFERRPVAADFSDNSLIVPPADFEEVVYMANGAVSAIPQGAANKAKNKARMAALKDKKETRAVGKAKSAPKNPKPCHCGCGNQTGGFFYPGHDARFKGWLLQIERGEETADKLLKKSVRDQYQWVKSGLKGEDGTVGMRPTKNYKGEPHKGYVKA